MGKTGSVAKDQKKYNQFKWATHLDEEMNERAEDLKAFLYKQRVIDKNSRYATAKYCLEWAFCEMIDKYPDYKKVIETIDAAVRRQSEDDEDEEEED